MKFKKLRNDLKKILSLLLAVIMAFSILPLTFAEEVTPVVMISGFGIATLTLLWERPV